MNQSLICSRTQRATSSSGPDNWAWTSVCWCRNTEADEDWCFPASLTHFMSLCKEGKKWKEKTISFTTASSSSPTSVSYDGKQFASGIALWLGALSHLWKCVAGQQLPDDSDGRGVMCGPLINRHWSSNIIHWEMLVSRSDGWQYSLPFTWKSLFPRPSGLMEL